MQLAFGGNAIEPNSNVLRRKLRSEPAGVAEQAVSPVKAVRMGIARASDTAFNLALRVGSIRQSRLDLAEAVEQIEEGWALFPLMHDDGSVGVMCFEPNCITAFVERQTLGYVRKEPVEPRNLTRTDKALAISFLDIFLRQFDDALNAAPTAYWTCGYRPEDAVASRHLMVLQLDANEYRSFQVQSDVVGTERSIAMRLLLPIKEKAGLQPTKKAEKPSKNISLPTRTGKTLQHAALAANVELDAIMCRIVMPLSELSELKPGQLLPLPQNAAQQAYLIDLLGRTAQSIDLGQLHGLRAVRLAHSGSQDKADADQDLPAELSILAKSEQDLKLKSDLSDLNKQAETEHGKVTQEKDDLDDLLQSVKA